MIRNNGLPSRSSPDGSSTRSAARGADGFSKLLSTFLSSTGRVDPLAGYKRLGLEKETIKEETISTNIRQGIALSSELVVEQNDLIKQIINEIKTLNLSGGATPSTDIDPDLDPRKRRDNRGKYGQRGRARLERRRAASRTAAAERIGKTAAEVVKGTRRAVAGAAAAAGSAIIGTKEALASPAPTRTDTTRVTAPEPTRTQPAITAENIPDSSRQVSSQTLKQRLRAPVSRAIARIAFTKVPVLGAVLGLFFGAQRAAAGDFTGAGAEVVSGVVGSFPGLGTVASLGIDASLLARDLYHESYGTQIEDDPLRHERLTELQAAIGELVTELLSSPPPSPRLPTAYNDEVRQQITELIQYVSGNSELYEMIGPDVIAGLQNFIRSASTASSGRIAERTRENMQRELARLQSAVFRSPSRTQTPAPQDNIRSLDTEPTREVDRPQSPVGASLRTRGASNQSVASASTPNAVVTSPSAAASTLPSATQTSAAPVTYSPTLSATGLGKTSAVSGDGAASSALSPASSATQSSVTTGGDDFMSEVNRVSGKFGVNPADMLALMRSESSLNPQAVNSSTGATGLIQFMPRTARSLGTTTEELRGMTAAQQMKYVEKYFDSVRLPSGASAGKLYAYVFLPGRANREVLTSLGENFYEANRGLDMDRDGRITISDLDTRMARYGGSLASSSSAAAAADQAQMRGSGRQVATPSIAGSPSSGQPTLVRQDQGRGEVPLNRRLEKQVA